MKERVSYVLMILVFGFAGGAMAGSPVAIEPLAVEGSTNTFFGKDAGANTTNIDAADTFIGALAGNQNTDGVENTFIGYNAGYSSNGSDNTFLGSYAGNSNTSGAENTFVGALAGINNMGDGNVFIGYSAGANEAGSDKLYIANSDISTPLIYGEFNNNKLTINGNLEVIGPDNGLVRLSNVTTDNTTKVSRMVLHHYSNAQLPAYLFGAASTATDNFVALGGGNTIGNAATQIDLFTAPNNTTAVGSPRITIKGNGNVGIGTQTPGNPLQMASGAFVTVGGVWTDASSREYKQNIEGLSGEEAFEALRELNPVKFAYKADKTEKHIGFIAEEAPDLIASKDRKGLSPMDIVAVLTKVIQEQQKTIAALSEKVTELEQAIQLRGTLAAIIDSSVESF